ncbi:MAG: HD domain-containing protein [Candidatus Tectimicrobiota bacterium]
MSIVRWSQEGYIQAYRFAAEAHQGQIVPGTTLPYIMHLSFVSMEMLAALAGETACDADLAVQCALLHDVLEDTSCSSAQLATAFGPAVAAGVQALSKDPGLPKARQMADCLQRIRQQPREIWMVKLADRITNLQPPPATWSQDKCRAYYEEALHIHAALGEASAFLSARFQDRLARYAAAIATRTLPASRPLA